MPFPRKFLNDGEDVVLDLHPHWWYFVKSVATLVLLLVAAGFAASTDVSYLYLVPLGLALVNLIWLGWRYLT
ncbi:MAG: PH domain-containing protein, partial [Actinobacteria bacterium]|nr:PH domain-containing protein [Actinomycetota bacterium]